MRIRTKIICTIGPAVDSYDKIVQLMEAGMDVARINFSHGEQKEHKKRFDWVKKARKTLKKPCSIMLDTKGPEIRISYIANNQLEVTKGLKLTITDKPKEKNDISIDPMSVLETVSVGKMILFDDGYILSKVVEKRDNCVVVEIQNPGVLKSRKGVNIPNTHLNLPAMTDKDIEDLKFGCEQDVDLVAASFIRSSEHVLSIKGLLKKQGHPEILVISKIENSQGIENFDSIVQASDGIMVARGDLGVELDLGQIPRLQKMMIRKCYDACKPVVTATQMLESMIFNPRPTRAEVSDVANAIYDGSSAVMLSGETAIGKYPIETVALMQKIAEEAEKDFDYKEFFYVHSRRDYRNISSAVAMAAVKTAYSANAKAIFAFTASGFTAWLLSRLKPEMRIIAVTADEKNYNQLAFFWGVIPLYKSCQNAKEAFSEATHFSLQQKFVDFGDLVVVTCGSSFGKTGSTNMMVVENIGDVLIRCTKGIGHKIEGKVKIFLSAEDQDQCNMENSILVIPRCDNTYLHLMKKALGVILMNHIDDTSSEKYALLVGKTFEIPVVVRAENALNALKEGETVTVDPSRGLVYRGSET